MRTRFRSLVHKLLGLVRPDPDAARQALIEAGKLEVGHRSYGPFTVLSYPNDAVVRIGAWTSIAHEVEFLPGGNHHLDRVIAFPLRRTFLINSPDEPWSKGDIVVGSDVWLGRAAKVLGGITIGHGAVVAAFSVVTRDVAPYTIVGGNPAREIGRRMTPTQAEAMVRIGWWDWDEEQIVARMDELSGPDVDAFIARYDPGP